MVGRRGVDLPAGGSLDPIEKGCGVRNAEQQHRKGGAKRRQADRQADAAKCIFNKENQAYRKTVGKKKLNWSLGRAGKQAGNRRQDTSR